jgi:putative Mg2+ transporter-C (MgtC) family protein
MNTLPPGEIALRLAVAFVAGALLGMERTSRGRAAGLRTTILACVASTTAMIVSDMMFLENSSASLTSVWRPDPARMAQGILTGIGFLGAGTILREETKILGVTTAATLWTATVLGVAFGTGHLGIGLAATGVALVTLHGLSAVEAMIPIDWYSKLVVRSRGDGFSENMLREKLKQRGVSVSSMQLEIDTVENERTYTCDLKVPKVKRVEIAIAAVGELAGMPGVRSVKWE